ncbi:primosomal protein N' [Halovulum dunhuangense]|uniref:Replication restart protein PriA n=2 Tax=Halovulum dunhuangense TaxID=1505036 RepID=A0A849L091_9RHOB|nr:primosomal protein N' [Halovulum dunhuangense]
MSDLPAGALAAVLTAEPLDRLLDYRVPEGGVAMGDFVVVPLGPRRVAGVVWGPGQGGFDPSKIRTIAAVLDVPPMRAELREFLTRAADYTLTPLSAMLRLATRVPDLGAPPGSRVLLQRGGGTPDRLTPARARVLDVLDEHGGAGFPPGELAALAGVSSSVLKGLESQGVLVRIAAPRDMPYPRLDPRHGGHALSDGQAQVAAELRARVDALAYSTTLLKGVTGSGKTEVYLEAVAQALARGRQALVLLPEIALTGAFLDRVEARFGARPAEWHSGVTGAERRRLWHAVAKGEAQLVVGARSALFLPFRDLGLIVVDEEHDSSYKQEEGALYHARDMAVLRASLSGAAVVLASATPSLETWVNARAGKYGRLDLAERFGTALLPEMRAIDMRADGPAQGAWLSPPLVEEIRTRIAAGEQSLLFLNRRGYAPLTLCRACGHQLGCHQCDARLVEHRFLKRLVCHQCGESEPIPTACPKCAVEGRLAALGPGVERVAEEAAALFPDARIAVLSSDQTESARSLKARIEQIASGGADIVVGTQIVAKGHNFPLLTLVGVVDADLGLMGGDLRGAERTFQLIRQVAGRAGRAEKPGLALVQTYQPQHAVIGAILQGDEDAFWQAEAAAREDAGAPPFGRMAGIILTGPDEARVFEVGRRLAQSAGALRKLGAEVYGPVAAPIARIRGRFRARMLVKGPKGVLLQPALSAWRAGVEVPANVRVVIDIDPQSFF